MTQSCKVRSEVASYGGPSAWRAFASACTVYMKISPRPVAMGPISGSMPAGTWLFTCCRRSLSRLRAKYRSVPSPKITVTCARPKRDSDHGYSMIGRDRKSDVYGKRVSGRVDLRCMRHIQKKKQIKKY